MTHPRILPPVPKVTLEVAEDLSPPQPSGFLRLIRRQLVAVAPDGEKSHPFVYDEVWRRSIDAVIIVPYFLDESGLPWVYLRSAARPPILLRSPESYPAPELVTPHGLWELPAGLVESDENNLSGLAACARRELLEELGFSVPLESLTPLGNSTYPCPGVIGERHYFFTVQVEPSTRREPELDGSPVEALGAIIAVSLKDALRACESGELEDAKTELGLLRLYRMLGVPG
jgi:ADP-ribose pyrophosphatase